MTKVELAETLAKALNLLVHLRASSEDGFAPREDDVFHALANALPEPVREAFWNNGTLSGRDLT